MRPLLPLLLMSSIVSLSALAAEKCTFQSGPQTAALIELYTSEGCSSCPPADKWLSSFVNPLGTRRVVPIAFHVSYWDYIGWKDPFADPRYTERQAAAAKAAGAHMVYTPQVMIGGRDARWRDEREADAAIDRINRTPVRAQIEVRSASAQEGGIVATASARLLPGTKADDLALVIAATQDGLSSRVTAGENRGEHLHHNFVAREFSVSRNSSRQNVFEATATFKPKPDWDLARMGVAAFVQNLKTGEVLQAVSGPLCRS